MSLFYSSNYTKFYCLLWFGRFHHPNLLPLFGYSESPPCFVSAFMDNGSSSDASNKFKVGVLAAGCKSTHHKPAPVVLHYLHAENPPVIHYNIKS